LKEFAKKMNEIDDIQKEIGNKTAPKGCEIWKRDNLWMVVEPPVEEHGASITKIKILTDISMYVEDLSEIETHIEEMKRKLKRMKDIVKESKDLGAPEIELMEREIRYYQAKLG